MTSLKNNSDEGGIPRARQAHGRGGCPGRRRPRLLHELPRGAAVAADEVASHRTEVSQ